MKKVVLGAVGAAVIAGVCVLFMGRSGGGAASIEEAIVPGADVLLRVDARINDTPIAKMLEQFSKEQPQSAGMLKDQDVLKQKLEAATGLTEKDVVAMLASVDIDPLDLMGSGAAPDVEKLVAVVAVQLAKPLTMEQLKAGLKVVAADAPSVVFADETIDGTPVVKITPDAAGMSAYAALSKDGTLVFIAPNIASMQGTLARSKRGSVEALAPDLAATEKAMPGAPQLRVAFLFPEALRTQMKEKLTSGSDPMMAMMSMYLKPVSEMKSLSFGMEFSDVLSFAIVGSFSTPEDATQVSGLVTMALPMLSGAGRGGAANPAADIVKKLKVKLDGQTLSISIALTEAEIKAALGKAAAQVPQLAPPVQ